MATYTQEAKRLVMVATDFTTGGASTNPGGVILKKASGAAGAPTAGTDHAMLELFSGDSQYQATNNLNLVSEVIAKGMVRSVNIATYAAPVAASETITPAAYTYSKGEEVILSLRFDGYGSLSMKNYITLYGAHIVSVDSETQLVVSTAISENLKKNLAKSRTRSVLVGVGNSAVTATAATSGAGITAVTGLVGAVPGVTYAFTATGGNAEVYYVTATAATTGILNRPTVSAAITAGTATDGDIVITAETQTDIDFQNMPIGINWKSTLSVDGDALPYSAVLVAGSNGSGWGEEVALIEEFANGATARNQWVEYRLMYDRRLKAIKTDTYDVVNVLLATTKDGVGSNVTSLREIQVYVKAGNGAVALAAELAAFS